VTTTQPATVTSTNALPGSVAVSQNPEVTAFTANTAPASSPAVAARLS
jgi:hypothetical protein